VRIVLVVGALLAVLVPAAPAAAAPSCAPAGKAYQPVPWAQQLLGTERSARFARGGGVTVAVLDTGVDARHPQLAGHVATGFDAVRGKGGADSDCRGHGTAVAGIIAAQDSRGTGFAGVAQGVTVLPVRVVDESGFGEHPVAPAVLARGVNWAVEHGADVIDVPVVAYVDSVALQQAVARALDRGVVVVAAAGDEGGSTGKNPEPYPASYKGVVGVGALARNASVWEASQHGGYVDLVAPGVEVVTLARGSGQVTDATGTGYASAFVAATAALVLATSPDGTSVDDVTTRLIATATPGPATPSFGHGVVNPYAATNERPAVAGPKALPALAAPGGAGRDPWADSRRTALWGTAIALFAALLAVILGVTLPRGRRRRWRAAEAPPPPQRTPDTEVSGPVLLFENR
jgi:type VII secretion-associated serine protease mycosin